MTSIQRGGHSVIGFGEKTAIEPPATKPPSPWPMVVATSVVSAAAGWAIDELARKVRGKRRQ